jgi:hypothetical protein
MDFAWLSTADLRIEVTPIFPLRPRFEAVRPPPQLPNWRRRVTFVRERTETIAAQRLKSGRLTQIVNMKREG